MYRFILELLVGVILCSPDSTFAAEPKKSTQIIVCIDTSGSMVGDTLAHAKEAAKLFIAILDPGKTVTVVGFSDRATVSPAIRLSSPANREKLYQFVDGLSASGGTNYLKALQVQYPKGAPMVFLSDGAHNTGPASEVLTYLTKRSPRVFTVGVQAGSARNLLEKMAIQSDGAYIDVRESKKLIETFLMLAQYLGNYRSHSPSKNRLDFKAVKGLVLALGIGTELSLGAIRPLYTHHARLPSKDVVVAAANLPKPTDLTIRATKKLAKDGHLAHILLSNLARARTEVGGTPFGGGELKIRTRFISPEGQRIDVRNRPDLKSNIAVFGPDGKIIASKKGIRDATGQYLEVHIHLPKTLQGACTVISRTSVDKGKASFTQEERKTIRVRKPLKLTVTPTSINKTVKKAGTFEATLQVKIESTPPLQATFAAEMEKPQKGLKLLKSEAKAENLRLVFEAIPGTYRGSLLVHATASQPVGKHTVPYEILVKPRLAGLDLPRERTVTIPAVYANSGKKRLITLQIPSMDEEKANYFCEVGDFTNGQHVIPTSTENPTVEPTKGAFGLVTILGDLGSISAGEYTSKLTLRQGAGSNAPKWVTNLRLKVMEPIEIASVDLGSSEVGKEIQGAARIQNHSATPITLKVEKPTLKVKGGPIQIKVPATITVPPGKAQKLPVRILLSDLVTTRGEVEFTLRLSRVKGALLEAPLRLTIVEKGSGPVQFLTSPSSLTLTGKAGAVLTFSVRIKLKADARAKQSRIAVQTEIFKNQNKRIASVKFSLSFPEGRDLTRATPVLVRGLLLAPEQVGTFTGAILVQSDLGTRKIPMTLKLK